MKLTAEDFTRQYREMSDDELLAIDPDELHDVARKCHQAEVMRRSLAETVEEAEEANAGTTESSGDLVSVATFVSLDAASAAYNALKKSNLAVTIEEAPDGPSLMVPWP